jgi:hypothetical protein
MRFQRISIQDNVRDGMGPVCLHGDALRTEECTYGIF